MPVGVLYLVLGGMAAGLIHRGERGAQAGLVVLDGEHAMGTEPPGDQPGSLHWEPNMDNLSLESLFVCVCVNDFSR